MKTIHRVLAIFAAVISIIALITAVVGGIMLASLLSIVTLGQITTANSYPLGAGVLVIYAGGLGLAAAIPRWPSAAGAAMLPLGAIAFLFGGPIAKVYGIAMIGTGALLVMTSVRRARN